MVVDMPFGVHHLLGKSHDKFPVEKKRNSLDLDFVIN